MATVAPVGGVYLQHCLPVLAPRHPLSRGVWSGPPSIRSYEPGETWVAAVAKTLEEREEFLADIRYRLEQAQAVQKRFYDAGHRPVAYRVGDWALLRLRQRAASSLQQQTKGKLKPRFYGPYQVVELINEVAVRLASPCRPTRAFTMFFM